MGRISGDALRLLSGSGAGSFGLRRSFLVITGLTSVVSDKYTNVSLTSSYKHYECYQDKIFKCFIPLIKSHSCKMISIKESTNY